jgi:hypothetical protein
MVGLHRAAVGLGPSCMVAEIPVRTASVQGLPGVAGGPDPDSSTTPARVLHALHGRGKCSDARPEKGTSVLQRQIGLKLHRLQRDPPSDDWFLGAGGSRAAGDQPLCCALWFSATAASLPASGGATCVWCRVWAAAAARSAERSCFDSHRLEPVTGGQPQICAVILPSLIVASLAVLCVCARGSDFRHPPCVRRRQHLTWCPYFFLRLLST